jgi:hypothetical protein
MSSFAIALPRPLALSLRLIEEDRLLFFNDIELGLRYEPVLESPSLPRKLGVEAALQVGR